MSSRLIARFEAIRLITSPGIVLSTILLASIIAGGTLLPRIGLADPEVDYGVAFLLGPGTEIVLPLVAVLLSYRAITVHRERGTVTLFLGAPNRRTDVFRGVLAGRIVVILVISVLALSIAFGTILIAYGRPSLRTIVLFGLLTCLAAIAYTVIGVSISAAVRTSVRAVTILVGAVFFFHTLWSSVLRLLHYAMTGSYPGDDPAWWFDPVHMLSPLEAYTTGVNAVLPPSPHLFFAVDDSGIDAETGEMVGGTASSGDATLAIAVLCCWMLGSYLIGSIRFRRIEF